MLATQSDGFLFNGNHGTISGANAIAGAPSSTGHSATFLSGAASTGHDGLDSAAFDAVFSQRLESVT
jgi:hypothetical protein